MIIVFQNYIHNIVTETVWHHTQKARRHKDGKVTLTFRVDGLNEIVRWVVGWAGRVNVIKPRELRELVTGQLRKALQMHDDWEAKEGPGEGT